MTLIAGIICRDRKVPMPSSVAEMLRRSISRTADDEPRVFEDKWSFFVKVDIGAFGEPAEIVDENGAITVVTGEPLLDLGDEAQWRGRELDTAAIHNALVNGDVTLLRTANG